MPLVSIVATKILEVLHVPPACASVSGMNEPVQTCDGLDIGGTAGIPVSSSDAVQPVGSV